jgi:hypothetical protein
MASTSNNRADPQETLANDSPFQFRFSDNKPVNTTIRGPDSRVLCRVTTFEDGTVTVVESEAGTVIASLRWSEMGFDKNSVGRSRSGWATSSVRLCCSASQCVATVLASPDTLRTVSFKDQHHKFKLGSNSWSICYANDGTSDAMPVVHFANAAFLSCSSISLSKNVKKLFKASFCGLTSFPKGSQAYKNSEPC